MQTLNLIQNVPQAHTPDIAVATVNYNLMKELPWKLMQEVCTTGVCDLCVAQQRVRQRPRRDRCGALQTGTENRNAFRVGVRGVPGL